MGEWLQVVAGVAIGLAIVVLAARWALRSRTHPTRLAPRSDRHEADAITGVGGGPYDLT